MTNEEVKPARQHHFSNGTEHKACKLEQSWKNLAFAALAAVRQCGMGELITGEVTHHIHMAALLTLHNTKVEKMLDVIFQIT